MVVNHDFKSTTGGSSVTGGSSGVVVVVVTTGFLGLQGTQQGHQK